MGFDVNVTDTLRKDTVNRAAGWYFPDQDNWLSNAVNTSDQQNHLEAISDMDF